MSSNITLSAATRQNLLSLQGTADLLSTTQGRLSTGKKVNSALDNPVNFFTSQSLNNRSSDLSGLLDGISNGIQAIQAANQGITSIQKLVDSAKSTASQALATKSTATGAAAQSAVFSATKSLSSALGSTDGGTGAAADGTHDFSGVNGASFKLTDATNRTTEVLLDADHFGTSVADLKKVTSSELLAEINNQLSAAGGTGAQVTASLTADNRLTFTTKDTGSDASVKIQAATDAAAKTNVDIGFGKGAAITYPSVATKGIDATDGSTKAQVSGAAKFATTDDTVTWADGSSDASLTIQLGNGQAKKITLTNAVDGTLTATGGKLTGSLLVDAINKQIKADTGLSGKVVASYDTATHQLSIRTTAAGSDQKLTIQSATTTNVDIGFGVATSGKAADAISKSGTGPTSANGTNVRASLAQQFNDLLSQITQQAQDASYNGVNLLFRSGTDSKENSLHISFNEKDSSSLDIKGVKFDAAGLGLQSVTGDFASDDDVKAALSQLTNASSALRSQSSTFGSNLTVVQNRQDFSKQLINILDTGSANLTNADMNEEAANSQALSTRNSLAISALSLANQAQQGILQLLR